SLARRGVKEIMLIAQELTYYGLDIYKKRDLPRLLHALADVEGIEWVRLHYAYPSKFPLEILDVIAERPEICNYLDMPLQHASNSVLERMRRQITREETTELIQQARLRIPNLTLRTTMLVGYPQESDQEFQELCDFVQEMEFDRMGVFQYSHEESTRAYDVDDDVSAELKAERANALMEIQQEVSTRKNFEKVGKTFKTLFDRKEGGYFVGRTEGDSPEVDNEVLVPAKKNFARIGDFAQVRITEASEYDIFGEIVA
ncbi:MAG TPA: radical SAM protein, partial [Haliscomenobacter sp.]|nr:radical SAM protein [Haliscomenobacter sp.]